MKKKDCIKCGNNIFYKDFCKIHFVEIIEKRIKKTIRSGNYFNPNEKILITTDVCNHFLPIIVSKLPLNIAFEKVDSDDFFTKKLLNSSLELARKMKITKVVLPITLDDVITDFFDVLISEKENDRGPLKLCNTFEYGNIRVIPFFEPITNEELNFYCKAKNFQFNITKENILDSLDEEFKDIKFATYKSILELRDLENEKN